MGTMGMERTHVDEIGPLCREVELCDEGNGLCDLCTDGLVGRM